MAEWGRGLLEGLGNLVRRGSREPEPARGNAEQTLRAILEVAPAAVVAWAADGRIILWSRGAERLLGWRRAEIEGAASPLAAGEHAAEEASLRRRILAGNEISGLPLRRRDRHGVVRELLLDAGPLRDADGAIVGGVSMLQEARGLRLSDPGRADPQGSDASGGEGPGRPDEPPIARPVPSAPPEAALLSRIAHDLRQPLLGLGLLAGALERRAQDAHSREIAADLTGIVRSLQGTFENIAEWTRLESGLVGVAPEAVPVAEVLEEAAQEFAAAAAGRDLDLRLVRSRAVVVCDPALLRRILRQFLDNAMKFTTCGAVLLGARRRGAMLRVIVADTGIGVPADRQAEMFEPYRQLDAGREAGGLGLGLAIARRLARLSNLPLGVRSLPGKGSQFWVEVPLAEAPPH